MTRTEALAKMDKAIAVRAAQMAAGQRTEHMDSAIRRFRRIAQKAA